MIEGFALANLADLPDQALREIVSRCMMLRALRAQQDLEPQLDEMRRNWELSRPAWPQLIRRFAETIAVGRSSRNGSPGFGPPERHERGFTFPLWFPDGTIRSDRDEFEDVLASMLDQAREKILLARDSYIAGELE